MTAFRPLAAAGFVVLASCASNTYVTQGPRPTSPEATVGQFLAAVNADDLRRMAELFGDQRGPSPGYMTDGARRDSIMAVLQHVLADDSARVTGTNLIPAHREWRLVHVLLVQGDRRTDVPFTVLPWRGSWLVQAIDILPLMPGGRSQSPP